MSEFTPEQISHIYETALQSVELLRRGEPINSTTDWQSIEEANKRHLVTVLAFDCWTTEDLTPLREAVTGETPCNVRPTKPVFNVLTQKVIEGYPEKQGGEWVQTWNISDLSLTEQKIQVEMFQRVIVAATQERLDSFARTRNYDGILSACTYATSNVPKFAAEGQVAVNLRDATWAALYQILEEVQAGQREAPTGFSDIEPLLPPLEWPV